MPPPRNPLIPIKYDHELALSLVSHTQKTTRAKAVSASILRYHGEKKKAQDYTYLPLECNSKGTLNPSNNDMRILRMLTNESRLYIFAHGQYKQPSTLWAESDPTAEGQEKHIHEVVTVENLAEHIKNNCSNPSLRQPKGRNIHISLVICYAGIGLDDQASLAMNLYKALRSNDNAIYCEVAARMGVVTANAAGSKNLGRAKYLKGFKTQRPVGEKIIITHNPKNPSEAIIHYDYARSLKKYTESVATRIASEIWPLAEGMYADKVQEQLGWLMAQCNKIGKSSSSQLPDEDSPAYKSIATFTEKEPAPSKGFSMEDNMRALLSGIATSSASSLVSRGVAKIRKIKSSVEYNIGKHQVQLNALRSDILYAKKHLQSSLYTDTIKSQLRQIELEIEELLRRGQ